MSLSRLTGLQRDLMYIIASLNQPSGQAVKERMEEEFGSGVTHGRLYPNLDTLVDEGFVTNVEVDQHANYYELSETGRQALIERRKWEDERL